MEECLPPYTMYIGQEVPKLTKSSKPFFPKSDQY